ncbi:uncharacterized protein SPSK_06641 [Sporothrix schenckii 1099-18]|uniref:Uncharacterized protein n=1 Tax=Sporothrix schenckii 1099-18 TaxID=1397361 RepID=A0A0F2MHJ9_SPOSC|nr:uncharacterized protein SPSK_06641 [Sporothrix schenckii 1099-18]KJR89102.1 hypothetical protein SPSK_06641 [Sporothrix schenckii 1099-18]
MVTSNNASPFLTEEEMVSANEKRLHTIETTQYIMEKPSQNSLASAAVIASTSTMAENQTQELHEKNGRLSSGSRPEGLTGYSGLPTPTSVHQNPFDTDVEAMITHTTSEGTSNEGAGRRSIACRGLGDSQVWPGQSHWKKKAKEQKMKRSCSCLSRLSKRNRLVVKVLIVVLVVGVAIGVGLGISKPLGAPIWGQRNS